MRKKEMGGGRKGRKKHGKERNGWGGGEEGIEENGRKEKSRKKWKETKPRDSRRGLQFLEGVEGDEEKGE